MAIPALAQPVIGHFVSFGVTGGVGLTDAFRTTQSFPEDSPHLARAGVTAGVGVEGKFGPIRIAPGVRYTRWGADSNANLAPFIPQSNLNQVEFLVGLKF